MAGRLLSVLVVDDNEDVRHVMRMSFELDGRFEVIGVGETAHDAIWMASRYQPDAILLDVRMPEMDGLAALPALRREAPASKVMLYSVLDEELMRPQLENVGVHDYVSKSTAPSEIVERMAELCADRRPSET